MNDKKTGDDADGSNAFRELIRIVEKLRGPGGSPRRTAVSP
jgi:hypothetical protein